MVETLIQFIRPGKRTREFREGFLSDDGLRLRTRSVAVPEFSSHWWREGLIPVGRTIHWVDKFHFYREPFGIMRFQAQDGCLLGYYCDILSPLMRTQRGYCLTDLFLDLWISPQRTVLVLDEDEFTEALEIGMITEGQGDSAKAALARLLREFKNGRFPEAYLDKEDGLMDAGLVAG